MKVSSARARFAGSRLDLARHLRAFFTRNDEAPARDHSERSDAHVRSLALSRVPPVVFVVDDDVSVREALEGLVRTAGWRVETFGSAQEFLARPRALAAGCLVLDVALPDINGLELQKRIAVGRNHMPIIFITGHGDVPTTVQAMKAGAFEFLTKPFPDDILLQAVSAAIERSEVALGREAEIQLLRDRYAALSRREQEVMTLVVSGLRNKQVGSKLGISEITVKAHRGRMMRKMKANSFADLVKMAESLHVSA